MYATITQLEDRLTARMLGTRVPESGADRERVLTAYIEGAGAIIDAALSAKYVTPASPTPLLTLICLNLAIWQIEADRGSALTSEKLPPAVQIPYEQATAWLAKLSSGEMQLSPSDLPLQGDAAAGLTVLSPPAEFLEGSPGMEAF